MKIAIAGASGRMGRMLVEATLNAADAQLSVALDQAESPSLGHDAGEAMGKVTHIPISSNLDGLAQADVLIDFTRPEGTLAHLDACVRHGTRLVIGTTGFDSSGRARIAEAAKTIPIVYAPNMSVGVNVTLKLLEFAARYLNEGYDVEITEAHHRHKVDAPSGTALKMGEVIANTWGHDLERIADWARHGQTGERESGRIGFSVIRGGDIVGDHTVLFAGTGERIEITHKSSSRATYAEGSIRAARFLMGVGPGLYDMNHVLGL